ncbi:hypothetical protein SAMN05428983_0854 [Agrobacterium fabrum]|uniref:Uncharacterized protein n=1 Tax=Agrobacterium fabrum TaxID=1176649 RepID=A0A7Z7FME0_9HYPH|nr:hypothetical protein [Agrobacterium fabrum]SDJ25731.1 hypothetical protein SAMN05428983_0854 [Agrobacterium fabrum]
MQSEIPDDVMQSANAVVVEMMKAPMLAMAPFIARAIMAEREAALSAAEPVATVAEMGAGGMRVLMPHPPGSADHLPIGTKFYVAPPAPSVAVKALEWKAHNEGFSHGRMHYGTGAFGHWYGVSRVKAGCWGCVHHIDGKAVHLPMTESLEEAKAAAQADYEARIRSALSAQVQDVAGWQLVPVRPTEEMLDAYWGQTGESEAMRSRVQARAKMYYHVMLAAAPAKQEERILHKHTNIRSGE